MVDISVYIITYYSDKYLKKTLDSVLSQKTNYTYEIIVSDDGSEDNTQSILLEYKDKYPKIFKLNFNKTNTGIPNNIFKARSMCSGRFIVNMDGDDYYIDDYKLEKQARFLDEHKEYDGVCTRCECRLNDSNKSFLVMPKEEECEKEFTIKDYENGLYLNQRGMMLRNPFLNEEGVEYFSQSKNISDKIDDMVDEVLILLKYKIYVLNQITDVYRVIEDKTANNFNSKYSFLKQMKMQIENYNKLDSLFGDKINFASRYRDRIADIFLMALATRQFKEFRGIYNQIPKKYKGLKVTVSCVPKWFHIITSKIKREMM